MMQANSDSILEPVQSEVIPFPYDWSKLTTNIEHGLQARKTMLGENNNCSSLDATEAKIVLRVLNNPSGDNTTKDIQALTLEYLRVLEVLYKKSKDPTDTSLVDTEVALINMAGHAYKRLKSILLYLPFMHKSFQSWAYVDTMGDYFAVNARTVPLYSIKQLPILALLNMNDSFNKLATSEQFNDKCISMMVSYKVLAIPLYTPLLFCALYNTHEDELVWIPAIISSAKLFAYYTAVVVFLVSMFAPSEEVLKEEHIRSTTEHKKLNEQKLKQLLSNAEEARRAALTKGTQLYETMRDKACEQLCLYENKSDDVHANMVQHTVSMLHVLEAQIVTLLRISANAFTALRTALPTTAIKLSHIPQESFDVNAQFQSNMLAMCHCFYSSNTTMINALRRHLNVESNVNVFGCLPLDDQQLTRVYAFAVKYNNTKKTAVPSSSVSATSTSSTTPGECLLDVRSNNSNTPPINTNIRDVLDACSTVVVQNTKVADFYSSITPQTNDDSSSATTTTTTTTISNIPSDDSNTTVSNTPLTSDDSSYTVSNISSDDSNTTVSNSPLTSDDSSYTSYTPSNDSNTPLTNNDSNDSNDSNDNNTHLLTTTATTATTAMTTIPTY